MSDHGSKEIECSETKTGMYQQLQNKHKSTQAETYQVYLLYLWDNHRTTDKHRILILPCQLNNMKESITYKQIMSQNNTIHVLHEHTHNYHW